jgi:hypothetical protein
MKNVEWILIFGGFLRWVEQRFSAALKASTRAASAADVPRGLKPITQWRMYAGLKACSTLS